MIEVRGFFTIMEVKMYCKSECHLSENCKNHIKNNEDKEKEAIDFTTVRLCRCETNYHDYEKVEKE